MVSPSLSLWAPPVPYVKYLPTSTLCDCCHDGNVIQRASTLNKAAVEDLAHYYLDNITTQDVIVFCIKTMDPRAEKAVLTFLYQKPHYLSFLLQPVQQVWSVVSMTTRASSPDFRSAARLCNWQKDAQLVGLSTRWFTLKNRSQPPGSGQEAKSPSSKAHLVRPLRPSPQQVSKARLHSMPGIVSFLS